MGNPISGSLSGVAAATAATPASNVNAASAGGDADFFQTLEGLMGQASDMQTDAQNQVTELLQGNGQDLHSAMIAVEKADLSFQLMMQVRNKIIQAYQTVSQMQF